MADLNEVIGGYKLRSLLQTGQKSQVFEVVEPTSSRHFAMKVLLPELATNADARRELFNDADVGIKMRHENVINILKVNRSPANAFFIMEFFPAGSLRTRLQSRAADDKQYLKVNAKKIFKQAATGLAYMNASGFVHADVKPDNILANAVGQTKIIDFALARPIRQGLFAKLFSKGPTGGSASFLPPEQIQQHRLDSRADIYSFGATLYEVTTGRPPFRAASKNELYKKHLAEKPSTPQVYNPDVTDEFAALVLKCLAKKKEDRYSNFHEVLIELKKVRVYKSVPDTEEEQEQWG
ncbi:MAG TPA: serine/threonine-protein kinase [Fimbriiglobus sp.]|nr:serine/threonine-protein kinase [Fimbriiglobus sp.]